MNYDQFLNEYDEFEKWQLSINPEINVASENKVIDDKVNHPPHYTGGNQEVIDTIEDAVKDAPTPVLGGLQWNVLKYIMRMWLKDNPKKDAEKAQWYLSRLIDKL
tara:strand:+ start:4457 stop:4771 length:315 start_codon:yes stop_codon:yes gene_type:complete